MKPRHQQHASDQALVESINVEDGLTEWEAEFVDSLLKQLKDPTRLLSEKQREIALTIQDKL